VDPVFIQNLAELMWDFAVYTALFVKQRPILATFTAYFISLHKLITVKKQCNKNFTWSILTLFTGQK
jgi:hypothetical protein